MNENRGKGFDKDRDNNVIKQRIKNEFLSAIDFRMIETRLNSRLLYFSQKVLRKIDKFSYNREHYTPRLTRVELKTIELV